MLSRDPRENDEAKNRVDVEIRAKLRTGEWKTILLYEAKCPRTLRKEDWSSALREDTNDRFKLLKGNAISISRQARRYVAATKFPMILICDAMALVGIKFSRENMNFCGTARALSAGIFYEDRSFRFLDTILSVAVEGLAEMGLIG